MVHLRLQMFQAKFYAQISTSIVCNQILLHFKRLALYTFTVYIAGINVVCFFEFHTDQRF